MTIAAGQGATASFKLNYDGLYLVEIAAERADSSRLGELGAEWSLWSAGQEIQRGSTAEAHSAPGGSVGTARVIGEFNGRTGQSYELQVRFASDAPPLQEAKPRLKVAVSGLAQENLQAASVLVFNDVHLRTLRNDPDGDRDLGPKGNVTHITKAHD